MNVSDAQVEEVAHVVIAMVAIVVVMPARARKAALLANLLRASEVASVVAGVPLRLRRYWMSLRSGRLQW